ncbi:sterol carrier protein domain-containing protein [Sphaerisporangium sp. NPDC051011]|uniref:sterol carrier protein domain-containing protein n=1 Tax=Sphaerisporangium sp. NPDC051011 TaxID=3155792 RepID=UPI0033EB02CA
MLWLHLQALGNGYPAGVSADTLVEVADPQRPANSGAWRLTIASGRGQAVRATASEGGDVPRLTIGGFSALFAGVQAGSVRRAGLLSGGTAGSDDLLGAAFAAKPYMIDYF